MEIPTFAKIYEVANGEIAIAYILYNVYYAVAQP